MSRRVAGSGTIKSGTALSIAGNGASRIPFGRIAIVGTIASLVTCYITIIFLGLIWVGITMPIEINRNIQAAIMALFALAAVVGLFLDRKRHERDAPLMIGIIGVAIILGTLYFYYKSELEFTGYLILIVAVFSIYYLAETLFKSRTISFFATVT